MHAGLAISLCGVIAIFIMLSFALLLRSVDELNLVIIGLTTMMVSCILLDGTILTHVSQSRYLLALVLMFAIGYPIGHTALIGLFAKVIKSGPQGGYLGTFAASGSLGRILFPTFSAWLVHVRGFDAAFSFAAVLLAFCLLYLLFHRKEIHKHTSD